MGALKPLGVMLEEWLGMTPTHPYWPPIVVMPDDSMTWSDWLLSAVQGAAGAVLAIVGVYVAYRLARRAERARYEAEQQDVEARRLVKYRIDAIIALSEDIRDISESWVINAKDRGIDGWRRQVMTRSIIAFESFAIRMIIDEPGFSTLVRGETEKALGMPIHQENDVDLFNTRIDDLYEWILRWAADPTIVNEQPTFF